jgi:hypothetical protein
MARRPLDHIASEPPFIVWTRAEPCSCSRISGLIGMQIGKGVTGNGGQLRCEVAVAVTFMLGLPHKADMRIVADCRNPAHDGPQPSATRCTNARIDRVIGLSRESALCL